MYLTAADIMTRDPITVTAETNLAQIATLLSSKRISAVPVCNSDHTMAGIVGEADVLRPFSESARVRSDWWLGMIAEGEDLSQDFLDYLRRDLRTAADVMVRHVITAGEDATLPQLAELMTKHAIKSLPILRDGRVVGIVSRSDLVEAIARAPAMLV